jgi:hypothetical protein
VPLVARECGSIFGFDRRVNLSRWLLHNCHIGLQGFEHLIVPIERRGVTLSRLIGLEGDLQNPRMDRGAPTARHFRHLA